MRSDENSSLMNSHSVSEQLIEGMKTSAGVIRRLISSYQLS